MILLLTFAFLSGLVTILAPCIWPLLPIILSSSIAGGGGHKRPLGITLGIMISFAFFTLTISYLVSIFNLDPNVLRLFAVIVIGFLGLTMLIPQLMGLFEKAVTKLSTKFHVSGQKPKSGFIGGFITGISLGIVWAPCAGPILASIAALAATQQVTFEVILVTLAYVTGVGIPLFAFAYGGQRLITRSRVLSKYTSQIQQVFGVIMILTALAIFTNYDKVLQVRLLNAFPQFGQALNQFESNDAVTEQLNNLTGREEQSMKVSDDEILNANKKAPEFTGITNWLNTEKPLTMEALQGKVVLIDFWTYTCINCIRTIPHVTSWYEKYKDLGFVVVGVHTPEFEFEKDTDNVRNAIEQYGIQYPVAQDNDYETWSAYQNRYWPAHYLIDAEGTIRRIHFGEGEYEETELAIQKLLQENGKSVMFDLNMQQDQTPTKKLSPETYFGSQRMVFLMGEKKAENGTQEYTLAETITRNRFSFGGTWTITDEYAVSGENAVLEHKFVANKVYMVAAPGEQAGEIAVFLDGEPVNQSQAGNAVEDGVVTVDADTTYELINVEGSVVQHKLRLEFKTPGTRLYTFTFGD